MLLMRDITLWMFEFCTRAAPSYHCKDVLNGFSEKTGSLNKIRKQTKYTTSIEPISDVLSLVLVLFPPLSPFA